MFLSNLIKIKCKKVKIAIILKYAIKFSFNNGIKLNL